MHKVNFQTRIMFGENVTKRIIWNNFFTYFVPATKLQALSLNQISTYQMFSGKLDKSSHESGLRTGTPTPSVCFPNEVMIMPNSHSKVKDIWVQSRHDPPSLVMHLDELGKCTKFIKIDMSTAQLEMEKASLESGLRKGTPTTFFSNGRGLC